MILSVMFKHGPNSMKKGASDKLSANEPDKMRDTKRRLGLNVDTSLFKEKYPILGTITVNQGDVKGK